MESGIGNTLRDARNRRKLDLSEVESATKIRIRFLRAIENEEWDVLPGDIYVRAFIKTYASYLGLDGERIAEDYRNEVEVGAGAERVPARIEPALSGRRSSPRSGIGGKVLAVVVVAALIGVLVAIGLSGGGDGSPGKGSHAAKDKGQAKTAPAKGSVPGVDLSLEATAEVWVCLVDAGEVPVIDGKILAPGEQEGPFHSTKGFSVAFGNGSVEMEINGSPAHLPESSSPIGFSVDEKGHLTELQEGERPECA